jgi:hypothetical protein
MNNIEYFCCTFRSMRETHYPSEIAIIGLLPIPARRDHSVIIRLLASA